MKIVLLSLSIAIILISGCISENVGVVDNRISDQQQSVENRSENQAHGEPSITDSIDPCSDDIYYDYDIVSGPDVDAFEGDRDNPFRSLTVHPTDPDILIIGTERNGFIKTNDGGNTWIRIREGLKPQFAGYSEIYDIGWSGTNTDFIYAVLTDGPCPQNGNYPCSGAGVYKSIDGGITWKPKNCGLPNLATLELFVDPGDENHVFVSIQGGIPTFTAPGLSKTYIPGGMYVTIDGGDSWNKVEIGMNDDKNSFTIRSANDNQDLIYAFGISDRHFESVDDNIGFIKSSDSGRSWEQLAPGLREEKIAFFGVSSDGNSIYTVSRDGYFKVSHDGGITWSEKETRMGSVYYIAVSPADKNRVLFGLGSDIHLSTDGLNSFNSVVSIERIGDKHVSDIVFSPSDPNIVYAIFTGAYPDNSGYDLYKSIDGGNSFSKIANLRDDVLRVIP
jgi:photosystem II stability/assembly factor-like uncharacterized protein